MDPQHLDALRALVDANRLQVVARLARRPADIDTLAADLRLPVTALARHIDVLVAAGLVERRVGSPERLAARMDRVGELGRALATLAREASGASAAEPGGAWPHEGESYEETLARLDPTPEEARTLRSYLVDGRLTTLPAQHRKRQAVLRFLLERVFTEDRDYPEKEVNERLALFHPDVASLRRYLVDDGYVTREAGLYRRRPR